MTEKSVREKFKEQMEIDGEYQRLAENEEIYLGEINVWRKWPRIVFPCILSILFIAFLLSLVTMPMNTQVGFGTFREYPFQMSAICAFFAFVITCALTTPLFSSKISKIENEIGLRKEELLYLNVYDTYRNIDSYLKESNPRRKLYFKRLALKSAEELTENVDGWRYGNIRLIAALVGDQIDLLKDNVRRLLLSNVAKGDEAIFKDVSEILLGFCKYLYSPSIEKLSELNDMIKGLPYKEYKYRTKREKLSVYLYSKPRFFRLLFACGITSMVLIVLWCLNQNIGIIVAVSITCFWGAFSGFDKLLGTKEK